MLSPRLPSPAFGNLGWQRLLEGHLRGSKAAYIDRRGTRRTAKYSVPRCVDGQSVASIGLRQSRNSGYPSVTSRRRPTGRGVRYTFGASCARYLTIVAEETMPVAFSTSVKHELSLSGRSRCCPIFSWSYLKYCSMYLS